MSLFPVFGLRTLLLLAIPVAIAGGILGLASAKGGGVLKKQGVAWVITVVMIVCAIGIGRSTASVYNHPDPEPYYPPETIPPAASADSFVWDDANVLSSQTERMLNQRNDRLWNNYSVTIGVVTCNYGRDDLDSYALKCAAEMGLGGYDFIVALDISGDNYWLIQGNDIRGDFSDQTCSDYAYDYMEDFFARGMYDDAVLAITEVLEAWYGAYYF